MVYQVLARKWRPKSLSQVQGQQHVTQALRNALKKGWLHHAYLFCGTRGVGKTSLARIFAKCLNCDTGITDSPCGECESCKDIDAGRYIDLIEVDAASRTRVEDTRDLLENVAYSPTRGRFKIYIIDEVHMLSGHSFNALLKTLEEPPEHVKFLFATTEPERIPVTVLSRVLRFDLRPIANEDILTQCQSILDAEQIAYAPQALHYVANQAKGSMRDALSLLEQVLAFCDGNLDSNQVADLLGLTYQERLPQLLKHIANKDLTQCLQWLDEVAQIGVDYAQLIDSLISSLHVISLGHNVDTARDYAQCFGIPEAICEQQWLDALACQRLYQITLDAKKDIPWVPEPKMAIQMLLMRMLTEPATATAPVVAQRPSVAPAEPQPVVSAAPAEPMPPVAPAPVSKAATTTDSSSSTLEKVRRRWAVLVESLDLVGFTAMLARHCTIKEWEKTQLTLALHPQQQAYLSADRLKTLENAINQKIGKKLRLKVDVEAMDNAVTPSQEHAKKREKEQAELREQVEGDQMVKALATAFDAQIGDIEVVEENHDR